MGWLDDEGFSTSFGNGGWKTSKGALVMARGPKIGSLYTLRETTKNLFLVVVAKEGNSIDLWHKQLGHVSKKGLKILVGENFILGMKSNDLGLCEHCIYCR